MGWWIDLVAKVLTDQTRIGIQISSPYIKANVAACICNPSIGEADTADPLTLLTSQSSCNTELQIQ